MNPDSTMTADSLHDFFLAGASVAGALIGMLFVAISVSGDRLAATTAANVDRIRARAALTIFSNSLVISLFALLSTAWLGDAAVTAAIIGLAFVVSSSLSLLRRPDPWSHLRDATFLLVLLALLIDELVTGWTLDPHAPDTGGARTLAVLVVLCFVIGIARSWELVGAPASTGIGHEIFLLLRRRGDRPDEPRGA